MFTTSDILQTQGILSKGFGVIPKAVMQDKRLTAEAKAIYGYFCSYAGAGQTVFPSRDKIISDLGMSVNRYYSHFKLLKRYGYITVERQKPIKGILQKNIYTLTEIVPCIQNSDMEAPCIQNPYMDNEYINNNSIKNNNITNKSCHVLSSQSKKKNGQDKTDRQDNTVNKINECTELVKNNISYNDLATSRPHDIRLVDEFIAIILDVMLTNGKTVRISGEDKPRALVRHNLLRLTFEDIEHVIDQFKAQGERISKKKQYILTMLYNCKMELDSHYTNLVKSDLWT